MLNLKVNWSQSKLDKGEKLTKDRLRRVLKRAMTTMEELAINNAPFDRGNLSLNISLFPQVLSNNYVLTSNMPYSEAIEYGTRPFYAPIDPLKGWASRKLGNENLGYAIQKKIAKYGITAQPFMRPALYQVRDFWLPIYIQEAMLD